MLVIWFSESRSGWKHGEASQPLQTWALPVGGTQFFHLERETFRPVLHNSTNSAWRKSLRPKWWRLGAAVPGCTTQFQPWTSWLDTREALMLGAGHRPSALLPRVWGEQSSVAAQETWWTRPWPKRRGKKSWVVSRLATTGRKFQFANNFHGNKLSPVCLRKNMVGQSKLFTGLVLGHVSFFSTLHYFSKYILKFNYLTSREKSMSKQRTRCPLHMNLFDETFVLGSPWMRFIKLALRKCSMVFSGSRSLHVWVQALLSCAL